MARNPKEGLDFAGWEVGVLDNDGRIDRLIDAQGIAAFTVYFYLCMHAYASHGYYLDWSYSQCATTARKLGRGASAEFVKNVVDMCFECCLFDKRLFQECGVLTSHGIQRRYWSAVQERVGKYEKKEFWLLKPNECKGLDLSTQNSDFSGEKPNSSAEKSNNSTQKNTKEENITLHEREHRGAPAFTPPTLDQVESYCKKYGIVIDVDHFLDYYTANGWVMGNGVPIKDWRARVRAWAKREKKSDRDIAVSEEQSEYEEMVKSYIPKYRKKGSKDT